ncbi:MAG: dodecin domain-containing protein [Pseudomonadota bacterium]
MADQSVYHNIIITGFSATSFDEAAKNAVAGAHNNHGDEYLFKSFKVLEMDGTIEYVNDVPDKLEYSATVRIAAVHRPHDDDHGHGY